MFSLGKTYSLNTADGTQLLLYLSEETGGLTTQPFALVGYSISIFMKLVGAAHGITLAWNDLVTGSVIFGVVVGLAIMIIQKRRHTGKEPSPYMPGRVPANAEPAEGAAVHSQDTTEFVDVSEPPANELEGGATATSTVASR